MKKLSGLERTVLALTLAFFLLAAGWFLYEDRSRDLTRVQVSAPQSAQAAEEEPEEDVPAPGMLEGERININTATAADLTRLPGIGEVKAESIVEEREANGPYASVEDLTRAYGIGAATLEKLLDYITVGEEGGTTHAENTGGG